MADDLFVVEVIAALRHPRLAEGGSLGVPALQASAATQPLPGGTVVVDVANLPLGALMMTMGFSNTVSGGVGLPRALAPFGMPGCNLLIDPVAAVFRGSVTNTAQWQLAIPNAAGLFGVEFFAQAFVFDFAANARGMTVSNGGRCRMGH